MTIPITFEEGYQKYLGLFIAFRKPLNERDMSHGHATWTGMSEDDRQRAFYDLRARFLECKAKGEDVKYVPHPARHLFARSWEREVLRKA